MGLGSPPWVYGGFVHGTPATHNGIGVDDGEKLPAIFGYWILVEYMPTVDAVRPQCVVGAVDRPVVERGGVRPVLAGRRVRELVFGQRGVLDVEPPDLRGDILCRGARSCRRRARRCSRSCRPDRKPAVGAVHVEHVPAGPLADIVVAVGVLRWRSSRRGTGCMAHPPGSPAADLA